MKILPVSTANMQLYRTNNRLSFQAAIHDCAKTGDLAGYRREVAKGVDPNLKDEDDWTPLQYAVRYRQHNIVEEAVNDKNVRVNETDNFSVNAPLNTACILSDRISEQFLLQREDINVNNINRLGESPIENAIFNMVEGYHWLVNTFRKLDPNADLHNLDLAFKEYLEYGNEDSDAIVCDLLNHKNIDLTKRDINNKLILDKAEERCPDAPWLNTLREKTMSQLEQREE